MASINGVTIKNYKNFKGHEWEDLAQGSIYLDGKRLGSWSQDSWGGPDNFDFDASNLNEACKNFKDGFPRDYKYIEVCDNVDVFLGELARLMDTEKHLKKFFKKGYKVAIVASNGWMASTLATPIDGSDTEILTKYAKDIEQMKSEMDGNVDISIFRPNSFDLIVDATHEVPTFLMSR